MQLREISNLPAGEHRADKIVHQLDNQGCLCHLCQRLIIQEVNTYKQHSFQDVQSQLTRGTLQEYYTKFLLELRQLDQFPRKVRLTIPETCVFEKGVPKCLLTKKKELAPLCIVNNKQKLNAFEIQHFFIDGFVYHNRQSGPKKHDKIYRLRKEYLSHMQTLRNECIVLAKFSNGSYQMLTPLELNNLFKSKERNTRSQILYLSTMVCAEGSSQIRVHIKLTDVERKLFERAKTEVRIIKQEIKCKDYLFVPEREERIFQDELKAIPKSFLYYNALKMLLLYSMSSGIIFQESLFKFMHNKIGAFYLTGLNVYKCEAASKYWNPLGLLDQHQRKQASSSPKRLQGRQSTDCHQNRQLFPKQHRALKTQFSMATHSRQFKPIQRKNRTKRTYSLKLQPITLKQLRK